MTCFSLAQFSNSAIVVVVVVVDIDADVDVDVDVDVDGLIQRDEIQDPRRAVEGCKDGE